jgi:hypothetical protein
MLHGGVKEDNPNLIQLQEILLKWEYAPLPWRINIIMGKNKSDT